MGSSKGPSQEEIEAAEREKARLAELRRSAELARTSRGRAQQNLGTETLQNLAQPTTLGPKRGNNTRQVSILEQVVIPTGRG